MPRSIIDIESSRPRLQRRRVAILVALIIVLLVLGFLAWRHGRERPPIPNPGKSAVRLNLRPS